MSIRTVRALLALALASTPLALGARATSAEPTTPGTVPGHSGRAAPRGAAADGPPGGLAPLYSQIGNLTLSVDGLGTLATEGTLQVQRPAGATVAKAFLMAASTGSLGYLPTDDDVTLAGHPVAWDPARTVASSIGSYNVLSDVTSQLAPVLEAAPAGTVDVPVTEGPTDSIDGEVLAVVWADPTAPSRSVYLMYGALSTTGDGFAVTLDHPLKPSSTATMSLGISYGYQTPGNGGQYSVVSVNDTPLTSSAGGQDDGEAANGALLTVGGIGDSTDNPPSTEASNGDCEQSPRCDDELYDLKALAGAGVSSFNVSTLNPSNDDNVFFAAFDIRGATATIGESVSLSPGSATQQVGTTHTVVGKAQDSAGNTIPDGSFALDVVAGPDAGREITGIRIPDGRIVWSYTSSTVGTDTLVAKFTDASGQTSESNQVTQKWTPHVNGTFGGSWPYNGSELDLLYSYGGGHKYLGNVVQGAANWNASDTHVDIEAWPGVPFAIHLPMSDVTVPDTWWGMTVFADDCYSCGYTANSILFNTRTLDPVSDQQRTKVATHEIGHALGLAHSTELAIDRNTPSVMWQGEVSSRVRPTPQQIDVNRVNGMYP